MDLIDTVDVEEALGRTLTTAETEQVPYYITLISNFIKTYTDVTFESVTETVKVKADYYGVVQLPADPIASVSDVKLGNGGTLQMWSWDGGQEIYDLPAKAVVNITFTHGYDTVPEDIRSVAQQAVKRLLLAPEGQDSGPLMRYRVGDVEEEFRPPFGRFGLGAGTFNDLEKFILDNYRITTGTRRIGFAQPEAQGGFPPPSTDDALFE